MRRLRTVVTVLVCSGWPWSVVAASEQSWSVELAPYAWLTGVDGSVSVAGRSASFDKSFSDLIDQVDMAYFGAGVVRYDRFWLLAQYDYMGLSEKSEITSDIGIGPLPPGTKVDTDLDTRIFTAGVGYQFDLFQKHKIDVGIGVRQTGIDTKLKAANSRSNSEDVTDGLLMVSPELRLTEKWRLKPIFSVGVTGDSDSTYELEPQVHYLLSDRMRLIFGYRKLHYTEKNGQKNTPDYRKLDIDLEGIILGFSWGFPGGAK